MPCRKMQTESDQLGPCLTDAAHMVALGLPFCVCRYDAAQTYAATVIAALRPGGA